MAFPPTRFWTEFLRANQLSRHCRWLVLPGMGFKDQWAWWREAARRLTPHEGIDLLHLVDSRGQNISLPPQALAVPLWEGEVAALLDDFLGRTVVICHPINDDQGRGLVSLYAHVDPLVDRGARVSPETPLARVARGNQPRKSAPPDHLHLSLAWLAADCPAAELNWSTLWENSAVQLIDPLIILPDLVAD